MKENRIDLKVQGTLKGRRKSISYYKNYLLDDDYRVLKKEQKNRQLYQSDYLYNEDY